GAAAGGHVDARGAEDGIGVDPAGRAEALRPVGPVEAEGGAGVAGVDIAGVAFGQADARAAAVRRGAQRGGLVAARRARRTTRRVARGAGLAEDGVEVLPEGGEG